MRKIERTGQFKRDYKRELKGRHQATLETTLVDVLNGLINDQPLPEKYKDHALTGDWQDHRDCHIKPGLVLIDRMPDNPKVRIPRGAPSRR
ncbi:MAG: type II toxin-antitoxin system YafQ family toxin [Gammaproteobacteria bacterium]|nr:type II toxin-antitoxin system YafQ family toxin [Gammaproteobacteria bacterium]